jgi:hypothetical protein
MQMGRKAKSPANSDTRDAARAYAAEKYRFSLLVDKCLTASYSFAPRDPKETYQSHGRKNRTLTWWLIQ